MSTKKSTKAPKVVQLTEKLNWYGLKSAATGKITNQLEIELALFNRPSGSSLLKDGSKNKDGIPKWKHFRNAVDLVWNYKGSPTPFVWHPDAIEMAKHLCAYRRLAIAGAGSTGKSDTLAVYALIVWLSKPFKNIVLVTTTTKDAAKLRIWGKCTRFFQGMIVPPPGRLIRSNYSIMSVNSKGEVSDEFGIRLFAGEKSKAAESCDAIRGIKHGEQGKLLLIMDEAPELHQSIMNVFNENLSRNPNPQVVLLGNPSTPFNMFGQFCEPKNGGWDSYNTEMYKWEGVGGRVLRLNAENSPNVIEGRTIYPFLMTVESLKEAREQLGPTTRAYFRGVLGAFMLDGDDENIYSSAELLRCPKECVWQSEYTKVAGFDNAFTHGGDKSILTIGKIGICTDGKRRLRFEKHYEINDDVHNKTVDRTTQIIRKLIKICEDEGVKPEALGLDASAGGGKTFADALWSHWSNKPLRVDFSGGASDKPVSSADRTKSSVRYANRVSELWYSGKEALRCNQLVNITKEMAEEMVMRKFEEGKAGDGGSRIRVESKKDMKKRTGSSPDYSDSGFILLELCRERHKFSGIDKPGNSPAAGGKTPMQKRFSRLSAIYAA